MADAGRLELHTMPQGVQTFLLEAQARGEKILELEAGVGTFLDPAGGRRHGRDARSEGKFRRGRGRLSCATICRRSMWPFS
jgi:hypothetical protein